MSIWMIAAAAVVGVVSVARLTRLLSQDTWPPVVWLRMKYENWTHGTGWEDLITCPYCVSVWLTLGVGAWGWASGWHWTWWAFNIWMAAAYLAAIFVIHDGE